MLRPVFANAERSGRHILQFVSGLHYHLQQWAGQFDGAGPEGSAGLPAGRGRSVQCLQQLQQQHQQWQHQLLQLLRKGRKWMRKKKHVQEKTLTNLALGPNRCLHHLWHCHECSQHGQHSGRVHQSQSGLGISVHQYHREQLCARHGSHIRSARQLPEERCSNPIDSCPDAEHHYAKYCYDWRWQCYRLDCWQLNNYSCDCLKMWNAFQLNKI